MIKTVFLLLFLRNEMVLQQFTHIVYRIVSDLSIAVLLHTKTQYFQRIPDNRHTDNCNPPMLRLMTINYMYNTCTSKSGGIHIEECTFNNNNTMTIDM